jgi:hypothetical protein
MIVNNKSACCSCTVLLFIYVSLHWNVFRHKREMKVVRATLKYLHVVVAVKRKIILHHLKYVP